MTKKTKQQIKDELAAIDRLVGMQIMARRRQRGLSQAALGASVGVSFQQIQKYELGKNRVSASKLWRFSEVLDIPVAYFFSEKFTKAGIGSRNRSPA